MVREHLAWAFPERDERWRRRVARASFRHLGREAVATFRLGRMGPEEVRRRTDVEGFEALEAAVRSRRGAIVVTGHLGNWEIGGASLAARGIPLVAVAQRQRNPLFEADLVRNRERLGMVVVERRDAPRRVLRALREGQAAGIVGDQNLRRGGVFVDFFGRKASTAKGAAVFALRTGAPVFVGAVRAMGGIPHRYHVRLEEVPFHPGGDMEEDALRLTEAHTRYLERRVMEAPEQYFWQHRRWKSRPPEER
jgi:KDO2-lipid IV(A) lauroyltransferase